MKFFQKKGEDNSVFDSSFHEEYIEEKGRVFSDNIAKIDDSRITEIKDKSRVRDVLEVHQIPETFTLDRFVLMPDDFSKISFDYQIPKGYDPGQVNAFKDRCENTVTDLIEKLTLRNEHIATLATIIDRLQVDAHNARFEAEIASGVSIIPTEESSELRSEILSLRAKIKELQARLDGFKESGVENQAYKELRVKYARLENSFREITLERDELARNLNEIMMKEALEQEFDYVAKELVVDKDSVEDGSYKKAFKTDVELPSLKSEEREDEEDSLFEPMSIEEVFSVNKEKH